MHNLFSISKYDYIKGKKPNVNCILCSIIENNPVVEKLIIYKSELTTVSVNLYPYNSGHLLIFPNRHICDIRDMTFEEENDIQKLLKYSLNILDILYKPQGYNFGYNMGNNAGASISHIHQHIIPRYPNELGFIDLIGKAKIIVEEPNLTCQKLKDEFIKLNIH